MLSGRALMSTPWLWGIGVGEALVSGLGGIHRHLNRLCSATDPVQVEEAGEAIEPRLGPGQRFGNKCQAVGGRVLEVEKISKAVEFLPQLFPHPGLIILAESIFRIRRHELVDEGMGPVKAIQHPRRGDRRRSRRDSAPTRSRGYCRGSGGTNHIPTPTNLIQNLAHLFGGLRQNRHETEGTTHPILFPSFGSRGRECFKPVRPIIAEFKKDSGNFTKGGLGVFEELIPIQTVV